MTHGTHLIALIFNSPLDCSCLPHGFALRKGNHVQESGVLAVWFCACVQKWVG